MSALAPSFSPFGGTGKTRENRPERRRSRSRVKFKAGTFYQAAELLPNAARTKREGRMEPDILDAVGSTGIGSALWLKRLWFEGLSSTRAFAWASATADPRRSERPGMAGLRTTKDLWLYPAQAGVGCCTSYSDPASMPAPPPQPTGKSVVPDMSGRVGRHTNAPDSALTQWVWVGATWFRRIS
jgi:hypothetical protein